MERETEPMAEAPSEGTSPTRKWVRQSQDLWSADTQLMGARQGPRGNPRSAAGMQIPTEAGRGFRFDVGQRSDLKPATIPI